MIVTPMICEDCHSRTVGFDLKTNACQDCHAGYDPDFMAQHLLDFGDDCLACHDGSGNIANFDHAVTQFPLGRRAQPNPMRGLPYQMGNLTNCPRECLTCHAEPEVHAGFFSTNCESCHTPVRLVSDGLVWMESYLIILSKPNSAWIVT